MNILGILIGLALVALLLPVGIASIILTIKELKEND